MGHVLKAIVSPITAIAKPLNKIPGFQYLADAALAATGNPELIPVFNGVNTYAQTGNVGKGLLSAGGSYLGGKLGPSIFGDMGTVGSTLGNAANAVGAGDALTSGVGSLLGSSAGNATTNLLSTPISNALGGYIGNSIATQGNQSSGNPSPSLGGSAFSPTQQAGMALPGDLSSFSGLDPNQQASNIANKGVYGGGLGKEDQSYFLNLINRQLVDPSLHDGNSHVNSLSSLSPIENSYLSNLGLGGYGNSNDLLQAMSKWNQ